MSGPFWWRDSMKEIPRRPVGVICTPGCPPRTGTSHGALWQPQRCKFWGSSSYLLDLTHGFKDQRESQRGVSGTRTHVGPIQTQSVLLRQQSQPWLVPRTRGNLEYFKAGGPKWGAWVRVPSWLELRTILIMGSSMFPWWVVNILSQREVNTFLLICEAKSLANEQFCSSVGNMEQKLRLNLGTFLDLQRTKTPVIILT